MVPMRVSCPNCGKINDINLDDISYTMYQCGVNIQDAFPDMNPFDREMLITGMCYDCQEKIFNRPAPGHEALWGNYVGECNCCGSPLYSVKHAISGNRLKCPTCGVISMPNMNNNMM